MTGHHPEAGSLVVYGGRWADRVSLTDVTVLSDHEIWPRDLQPALDAATALVVLDPMSFPFEQLRDHDWEIPFAVAMATPLTPEGVVDVLGEPLLDRLTALDRIVTDDDELWGLLHERFRFAASQRIALPPEKTGEILDAVLAGDGSDRRESAGTVGVKVRHLAKVRALEDAMRRVPTSSATGGRTRILQVGGNDGRWLPHLPSEGTVVAGVVDTVDIEGLRRDYPDVQLQRLGDGSLSFPDDDFDVVVGVDVVSCLEPNRRGRLLGELWRVARPGGQLILLDDFVPAVGDEAGSVTSYTQFAGLLLEATAWRVTLEELRSFNYPGEVTRRAAVVALTKLGPPARL